MMRRLAFFARWQCLPLLLAAPGQAAFVARGARGGVRGVARRVALACRCAWIHLRVQCQHNPMELLAIVEDILDVPASTPGVIVECGAFTGGSSAKLSLAASMAGRRLIVCDSFQGLPRTGDEDDREQGKSLFRRGDYASPLDTVRSNVARHGRPEVVTYVAGWFDESLPALGDLPIACTYWDVDLAESFRACARHLWSGLVPSAKAFIHDIDRQAVVRVFTDVSWWQRELGLQPPVLVGAGVGLSRRAPLLGYAVKE
jgi:hypothetical protein